MATYNGHNEDSSGNILLSIGNGMTATVETGTTASQAYTKGTLLFFNNRLCKATTAISSGATLAVGTNLSQTSLGAELTSHLRSSDGKEFYFDVKDGTYGYYPSASKVSSEFVPFGGTTGVPLIVSGSGSSVIKVNKGQRYLIAPIGDSQFVLINGYKGSFTISKWDYAPKNPNMIKTDGTKTSASYTTYDTKDYVALSISNGAGYQYGYYVTFN